MPKRRSHREINQELFFQDGKAVLFYLMGDRSPMTLTEAQVALSEKDVEELTRRIEDHGGEVCDDMEDARVIIVNDDAVEKYQRFYRFEPDKDVEPPSFVRECIDNNEYRHLREMPVRLGFEPPTKPRRDFTAAEDRFLAEYIALRIPEAEAGGRMGNKIYMELVEHAWEFDHGPWVMGRNHTWHSWRERYKKKPEVFNAMIDLIIKKKGVRTDDKTKYPLDRRRKNKVTQIRLDSSESEAEAEESDTGVGQDEADYQPRGRKRRARSSVGSNAGSRPPRKRARAEVQPQDDSEEEDEYLGFELEPDAVDGTAPSPAFSRQVSPEIPEAGPSTAVKGNRPRPRPVKSLSTQGTAFISSQKTLVNSTQHSARLESSASYKPDSSQEFEEDHTPEPRQLRSRELKTVSQGDVSGPRRSLGTRVEVVVPPLRYSRSPAKTRAKQKERNSMPPIATISRSPSKVDDGDDSGVEEQDEDANPEDEEDELVDDSYIVDAAQYGEPDDVPSQEADMDANEEDTTQQVEEAAESGFDREERVDEDEGEGEEDSEANHIFDLDPSSDDEEDEVSNLISPVKAKVVDDHSESDFKAQRSLMNAQLDEADSDSRSSSPESSPVPKPRRSTRRAGTVQR